jgi:hypothetical protein
VKFDVWRVGYQCLELRCETPADADLLQEALQRHGHAVTRRRDDECTLILHAPPRRRTPRATTLAHVPKQPGVEP